MKRLLLIGLAIICAFSASFAQIPLATQGFESGDTWTYSSYPDLYDFNNGDAFTVASEYQTMVASSGTNFLAFQDLVNPNAPLLEGQTNSYYYHHLTFATIQIPQPSPADLKLSFSYLAHALDGTDYMAYELQFNNDDTWNSDWVSSVDTSFAFSAYLSKDTEDLWVTHTIDIPDTVSFVRFRVGAYQNGGSDWGGFDDFSLFFDSAGDFVPPNVADASITSDQTIVLTFDEAVQSASVSIADYGISSSTLSEDGLQMTLNLSSALADGDFFDVNVDALTDISGNQTTTVLENLVHNDFVGNLVITEINYNDPGPYDNLDYFEIYNNGDEAYPLGGLSFNQGVNVNFPEFPLGAGEYAIVAQPAYFLNDACGALTYGCGFQSYFGFAPTFEIASGYLGAGLLQCVNTVDEVVISVDFDYSGDWPANANGNGYSIVLCDPSSDMNVATNWALSSSIQYAVSPEDSVLAAMGLSGFTQYYADPAGPCAVGDILPPTVVNIYAVDASTVVVVYDEAISVDGTYDGLAVASSSISGDTVTLALSTPLELATIYSVTISGTQDAAGNSTLSYGVEVFYNTVSNLFISEFAEGSSSNKYMEIYNASDAAVDLSFYAIANTSNAPTTVGVYEYWTNFPDGSTIEPQGTFIITHPSADSVISSVSDMTYNYLSNGDDGFALVYGSQPTIPVDAETGGYTIVDFAGDWNGDPGSGWEVAGVSNATQNHTLVRKCSVEQGNSDWTASAGTSAEDSEWIVLEQDDWSDLGSHTTPCPDVIPGCTDETASNFNSTATEDDGSCEYLGCTDETAVNFDASAVTDDGSCVYPLDPMVNLFISEYSEGSSSNKYLEIYNPTADTVSLASYAWPSVSNAPSTVGAYEYWNSFAPGAQIAPYGVYVVANPGSDLAILNYADETGTVYFNGDDGYALVYGFQPTSPSTPEVGGYVVLDIVGDWNGDPGSGWEVAGVSDATKDHTLVRKCSVEQGNANDWTASAGTNADDSEWIVLENNDWSNLGVHTSPCPVDAVFGCTDPVACNFDSSATDDDGSCEMPNECGSCEGDLSCLVNVTVSVDMSVEGFDPTDGLTYDGLEGTTMAVRLDGGSWEAMSDEDADGVWTATFSVAPNSSHVYNFNDGNGSGYESGSNLGECAEGTYGNDRTFTVESEDLTVATVCWESCEACPEVIVGCTDETASNYNASATEDDGSCTYPAPMVNLFFSEYAEGSSSNKYLEIYNPSSEAVNLSDYTYNNCSNDCDDWEYSTSFADGAIIPAGGTYSVCHSSFAGDQSLCDETVTLYFNGNDAQGLVYVPTGEVLDVIGDTIGSAEYWSVAGVSSGTKDHTLVRKCSVEQGNTDWAASSGTTAEDSEWIVFEQNNWDDLGSHTTPCPEVILGCTDAAADNYNSTATEDDGSCEYLGCTDESAENYDPTAVTDDGSCTYPPAPMVNLFFSEYAEGSSSNKYLEIYNPTSEVVSLADYGFPNVSNSPATVGEFEYWNSFAAGAEVPANGVYIIAHGSADSVILASADMTHNYLSNGDDGYALAYGNSADYVIMDFIGDFNGDPGSGWEVAGVSNATQNHTLVRKCSVEQGNTDWTASAGTNADDSEWIVLEINDWSDLGIHNTVCAEPIPGCTDATAINFNAEADTDDGSCTLTMTTSVCGDPSSVMFTGPWWGWAVNGGPSAVDNGDGTWTFSLPNMTVAMEYLLVVDGTQENLLGSDFSCTPVTDGANYANRQWNPADGYTISNVFNSCEDPSTYECPTTIAGCTDSLANNFNAEAEVDNGSCLYNITFNVDMRCHGAFTSVLWVSEWTGWGDSGWNTMTDEDEDGIYSFYIENVPFGHNYKYAVDGVQEDLMGLECAPSTDGANYANRVVSSLDIDDVFASCEACDPVVLGCTDASADNYNPNATDDDGSCTFCNSFEAVLIGTSDVTTAGGSDGSAQATGQGGSNNYDVSVIDANAVPANPFALSAGDYTAVVTDVTSGCIAEVAFTISDPVVADNPCDIVPTGLFVDDIIHNRVVFNWSAPSAAPSHYMIRYRALGASSWTVMTAGPVNSNEFTGTSRTRYFMEPGTTYEWSMRARVLNEDGSTNCQSSWSASNEYTTLDACANLENLSASTEAVWATLSADAPAAEWGVWQSKGKLRVVGTNSFRYVNGDSDGNISVLKGNFDPSTDYEWHTKAWCTGNVDSEGNSDPMYHSGWGDFSTFSTQAPCDKMPTNLTTVAANNAQTAITMSWDTPETGAPDHYFLELTNVTTGQVWAWNNIAGSDNSKSKYGLTAGDYSWRIRGACGTNGTSWATIFSQPATYTLGGARLESSSLANLDVYPNPSRDIFNVTFTSEEAQTMTVKVVNMIGEEIFTEELTEFVGQYTQVIDMNTQPKGVYFLEITTSTGGINKKIVLQ